LYTWWRCINTKKYADSRESLFKCRCKKRNDLRNLVVSINCKRHFSGSHKTLGAFGEFHSLFGSHIPWNSKMTAQLMRFHFLFSHPNHEITGKEHTWPLFTGEPSQHECYSFVVSLCFQIAKFMKRPSDNQDMVWPWNWALNSSGTMPTLPVCMHSKSKFSWMLICILPTLGQEWTSEALTHLEIYNYSTWTLSFESLPQEQYILNQLQGMEKCTKLKGKPNQYEKKVDLIITSNGVHWLKEKER
jgi:hypothetical protein